MSAVSRKNTVFSAMNDFGSHGNPVSPEVLVRHLCVIFLHLYELVVKINVVHLSFLEISH